MRRYHVEVGGRTHVIDVMETSAYNFTVVVEGQEYSVTLSSAEDLPEAVITPGVSSEETGHASDMNLDEPLPSAKTFRPAPPHTLPPMRPAAPPPLAPAPVESSVNGPVKAPMPGTVTAVEVRPGDEVQAGQVLLKLEAMKMVNAIKAPRAGIISEVRVQPGESVGHGHVLVTFEESR